jgi:hypothetical protein
LGTLLALMSGFLFCCLCCRNFMFSRN